MSSERLRDPAPLEDKAAVDLYEVSEQEHCSPSDPRIRDRVVRRLERATPEGVGAEMEPNRLSWWILALPALSFAVALVIAVWILASPGSAGFALLIAIGFIILSNAPLIGAIWMRQRDKRHLEQTVDREVRQIDARTFGAAKPAGGPR